MKAKKVIIMTCTMFLLMTGCTNANELGTDTVSSAEDVKIEHLKELIADYQVKIQGFRWDIEIEHNNPKEYYMRMLNPEITEYTKDSVTATGILSNEWHATENTVTITYTIQNDDWLAASTEEIYVLTPRVPFLSEESKESVYDALRIYCSEDISPENYPLIEIGEGSSADNYQYYGSLIITDKNGQKYVIPEVYFNYTSSVYEDKWQWKTSVYCYMQEME